jgi:hypothetical protein
MLMMNCLRDHGMKGSRKAATSLRSEGCILSRGAGKAEKLTHCRHPRQFRGLGREVLAHLRLCMHDGRRIRDDMVPEEKREERLVRITCMPVAYLDIAT